MKHTRFEYIGPNGREITLYGEFEQSVQDDGQTLKVFGSEAVNINPFAATQDATQAAIERAFLLGFLASGEGWNGEYPFQDNNLDPEGDRSWVKHRAECIAPLLEGSKQ